MTLRKFAISYRIVVVLCVSWMAISCGGNGASNNDQGVAVTFLGLFNSTRLTNQNSQGGGGAGVSLGQLGCGQLPAGISGGYIPLGDPGSQTVVTVSESNPSGIDPAGGYVSVVGVQNNLYGQAFRVERMEVSYFIPGAQIQPPSSSLPLALIAGPAESASRITTSGGNQGGSPDPGLRRPGFTSLPPSFSNLCNRALAQVTIIPRSTIDWLNINRGSLPQAPFNLEVNIRLFGQSSAGDVIETNDGFFLFDVLPEDFVVPVGSATPAVSASPVAEGSFDETEPEDVGSLDAV